MAPGCGGKVYFNEYQHNGSEQTSSKRQQRDSSVRKTFGKLATAGHPAAEQEPTAASAHKLGLRVLVVDDDVTIRELAKSILAKAGFDVEVLDHGSSDQDYYANLKVDAAIVDLGLPGLSGPDVIANLRSHQRTANLPIIICTSSTDIENIHDCFVQHDALTVVQKPVDWQCLIDVLKKAIGKRVVSRPASNSELLTA